jgi:hypothetical protein
MTNTNSNQNNTFINKLTNPSWTDATSANAFAAQQYISSWAINNILPLIGTESLRANTLREMAASPKATQNRKWQYTTPKI